MTSTALKLSILLTLSAVLIPSNYAGAVDDTCYFITSSGQRMGLGRLCGDLPSQPKTARPTLKSNGVVSAKIKRRIASTPVIEVTFNGDRKFDMIVDTGASGTLITRDMATELQAQTVGSINAGIADGSTVNMQVAQVRSMSVNGIVAKNVRVAIAERMDIGLLGHDFFGNYDLKIKRDVVEFYPRSN